MARSRSLLIVPSSAGKFARATRGREAADRIKLSFGGTDVSSTESSNHLNTTTEDRGTGLRVNLNRGAGCGKSARPDLWEPWVSNGPRPPGDSIGFTQELLLTGYSPAMALGGGKAMDAVTAIQIGIKAGEIIVRDMANKGNVLMKLSYANTGVKQIFRANARTKLWLRFRGGGW